MAKALAAIDERKLANIRLHHGDATDMLAWLPSREPRRASICSIPIRGRSGGTGSAASCRTKASPRSRGSLRPGGEFRFASDIPDYVAWTLMRLMRSPDFTWTAEQADDWRWPWPGFTGTRYEAKAKREGRAPCYLIFGDDKRHSQRLNVMAGLVQA